MEPILRLSLDIPRAPADVRAWWLTLPDDYRASDPREQPHRIVVRSRSPSEIEVMTYWRLPLGVRTKIRERLRPREDGWDVLVDLPAGIEQRDEFRLFPDGDGTRVDIAVWIGKPSGWRALLRPLLVLYGKRSYPRTWRDAARICARDAPATR